MKYFSLFLAITACFAAVAFGETKDEFVRRFQAVNISLGKNVLPGVRNWRVGGYPGYTQLSTRLFNAPLPGGDLLVGWTDSDSTGHVSYLKKDSAKGYVLKRTVDITGLQVRGIAALSDSSFGVLAWYYNSDFTQTKMYVQKWSAIKGSTTPTKQFQTDLVNSDNFPSKFDIGDSRMEYDSKANMFYVYYHVHSDTGHEGDTYYKVNAATGASTKIWNWGCSHSMSNLLSFHPQLNQTLSLCVTDCYPGTSGTDFETNSIGGLYTEDRNLLQQMAGGCNGCVGGEVGMVAPVYGAGWVVIFNSHSSSVGKGQAACTSDYNQDIGLAFVSTSKTLSGSVKWLKKSTGDEVDPGLARFGPFCGKGNCPAGQSTEWFLVGWKTSTTRVLGFMDSTGAMQAGPFDVTKVNINGVSTSVSWGARDDTWRTLDDGSVAWLEAPASPGNILRVFVLRYGNFEPSSSSTPASSSAAPPTPPPTSSSAAPHTSSSAAPHTSSSTAPHTSSSTAPHTSSSTAPHTSSSTAPHTSSSTAPHTSSSTPVTVSSLVSSSSEEHKKTWTVEIVFDDLNASDVDTNVLIRKISEMTGTDQSMMNVSLDVDDDGHVLRALVVVENETVADAILETLDECLKPKLSESESESVQSEPKTTRTDCSGVLAHMKSVRIIEKDHTFISRASRVDGMIICIFIALIMSFLLN